MCAAALYRPELPPQRRTRAMADLEKQIAIAETTRARWFYMAQVLTEAGRQCRREQAMVRLAEEKLRMLRGSIQMLNGGHPP
jgi:hypothetical protein